MVDDFRGRKIRLASHLIKPDIELLESKSNNPNVFCQISHVSVIDNELFILKI